MRERTIQEEFEEADREIAVEEVRMKRDLSIDELLTSFVLHCRDAQRLGAEARGAYGLGHAESEASEAPEIVRIEVLFRGPEAAAR